MASIINAATSGGLVTTADTSGILQLQTAGTTAVTVNASQNVTFVGSQTLSAGTANGVAYLNGSKVLTSGSALTFDGTTLSSSIASAASGISLDSSTAGKANTVYRSAGTQKAIVGLAGAILGTSSTDLGLFAETGGAIKLYANGASTNSGTFNQYGFGIGAAVPSSGQGITFPAAQDASSNANTLDDYEEGTFTLTATSAGYTASSSSGAYTKIGRLVYCKFTLRFSAVNGSSNSACDLSGFPFANTGGQVAGVSKDSTNSGAIYIVYILGSASTGGITSYSGNTSGSTRTLAVNEDYVCNLTYQTS
jgi:hypothetical protein